MVGCLWAYDPQGPYEPITFVLLLMATIVATFSQRVSHRQKDKIEDLLQTTYGFLGILLHLIEERYNALKSAMKRDAGDDLVKEIRESMPELVREAVSCLKQEAERQGASDEAPVKALEAQLERSLAEAYGIEAMGAKVDEVGIADAKPWRFKGLG